MAKENEKKVSGDMSSEELENVAGGWCLSGGVSAPKEVTSVTRKDIGGGNYEIHIVFSDGNEVRTAFDKKGNSLGSADVFNK